MRGLIYFILGILFYNSGIIIVKAITSSIISIFDFITNYFNTKSEKLRQPALERAKIGFNAAEEGETANDL